MRPTRWNLVPHLLLRRAGFPFELIERLACPKSSKLAAEMADRDAAATELRSQLLRRWFPEEVKRAAAHGDRATLRKLSVWRRRVGRGRANSPPDGNFSSQLIDAHLRWTSAFHQSAKLRAGLADAFAVESVAAKGYLREMLARDDIRQALFLLVPALLDVLDAPSHGVGERASDRALERRLYSFIQRLASKNETTSFFGPLTHAVVDPTQTETQFGPETATGARRREVFASFWAVAALATRIAADPDLRAVLPVRRIAASGLEGEQSLGPDGTPVPLEPMARKIFEAVDDRRTTAQLCETLGFPRPEVERHIRVLEKTGFVRRDLEPPSTSHHPLEELLKLLPNTPASSRWREALQTFQTLLKQFEEPSLAQRRKLLPETERHFEAVTGKPAQRGAGQMYADRTVLFEDCEGDLTPVRLGTVEARRIEEALAPALQLGAGYGRLRHGALVELATRLLADTPMPVRFLAFATELDARIARGALGELDVKARQFLDSLVERVRSASDGRIARLSVEALGDLLSLDDGPRFASPDVMLERGPGGAQRVIIGEVHPYVFAWGSQGYFAPSSEALQTAFRADLRPWGGESRIAVVLRRRRHKGLVTESFPGTFIEVSGRSGADPSRRVAIADLHVRLGADGVPELFGPRGPLTLYVGEDDHPHLRVFAPPLVEMPPVRLGLHTPRVEIGNLVFQRERWDFDPDPDQLSARDPLSLMTRVAAMRRTAGWPRFVFLSAPSEPKPLCLDLDVPQAQAHLQRLLAMGRATVIEMLPAPDALWLRRSHGPYTSELRLGMLREG